MCCRCGHRDRNEKTGAEPSLGPLRVTLGFSLLPKLLLLPTLPVLYCRSSVLRTGSPRLPPQSNFSFILKFLGVILIHIFIFSKHSFKFWGLQNHKPSLCVILKLEFQPWKGWKEVRKVQHLQSFSLALTWAPRGRCYPIWK